MGVKGNSWDNPCYNKGNDCPDRIVGCHSTCQKHLAWLEQHKKLLNKKRQETAKRNDIVAYTTEVHQKLNKVINQAKRKRGWVK